MDRCVLCRTHHARRTAQMVYTTSVTGQDMEIANEPPESEKEREIGSLRAVVA